MNAVEFLASRVPLRDLSRERLQAGSGLPDDATGSDLLARDQRVFERISEILFRSQRQNVLLTGPRGVGKTATALQFAAEAARGAFRFLQGHRVLWLDMQHIGPEDSRACLETLAAIATENPRCLLCIDGLHALMRRPQGGSNKAFLLALLQSPSLRIIGVLPRTEYGELFAGDIDLLRVFDHLELPEPSEAEALPMVTAAAQRLQQERGLMIDAAVIRRAVQLTSNYILNEYLPDKAIRALQEACDRVAYRRGERGRVACPYREDQ